MYAGVPTNSPVTRHARLLQHPGQPEVGDLSRPSGDRSMLLGLTSRWMTPGPVGVVQGVGHVGNEPGHSVEVPAPAQSEATSSAGWQRGGRSAAGKGRSAGRVGRGGAPGRGLAGRPPLSPGGSAPTRTPIEGGAVDEFHRVEVEAVVLACGVHRNDVGVVQAGRCLGFPSKSIDRLRAQARGPGPRTFRATQRFSDPWRASYTTPIPPRPNLANDLEVA